jgi:hypothetical protein
MLRKKKKKKTEEKNPHTQAEVIINSAYCLNFGNAPPFKVDQARR